MNSQRTQPEHPKAVEDCHELLAWIIPKLDQFPRQRRFTLCCRVFMVVSLLLVTRSSQAEFKIAPQNQQGIAADLNANETSVDTANMTGIVSAADPEPPAKVHEFTLEQIESMRQSCRASDGGLGPAMVVIRPKHFTMGSDDTDPAHQSNETPKHPVTIPRPFAVSRCEITVGQFRQFINATGHTTTAQSNGKGCTSWNNEKKSFESQVELYWDKPGFSQSEQQPVVCVSWDDAQAYVKWLSGRSGAVYRLLTEAEWEYVARADTVTPRYFSDRAQCQYANGADQTAKAEFANWTTEDCADGFVFTAPVAQFEPNAFGLFDVLGNVWEWTEDCWHDNYAKDRVDGSQAWLETESGDCLRRVVRGGSWDINPGDLRSAVRYGFSSLDANFILGFRIARAL